ncbi:hypothetical protein PJI16_13115 [Nitrospira sp. MA-1]|nr:hypothetical protein [Nitrospira sp. MA-1]
MKNVLKEKSIVLLGSLAGTCLLATVAFANPSMLPDHAGYPMKETKSPVTGSSTAYDSGQENLYGQKALNAATKEYTEDLETRRSGSMRGNESESQKPMGDQSQIGGQDQDQMAGQEHMTGQDQMAGKEHMTGKNQTTGQDQNEGQNQMRGLDQIKSQSQSELDTGK